MKNSYTHFHSYLFYGVNLEVESTLIFSFNFIQHESIARVNIVSVGSSLWIIL